MRETAYERAEREANENTLYEDIKRERDLYTRVSKARTLKLAGDTFSMRWVMYYAQIRNRGVKCTYSSCMYADQRMWLVSREQHLFHYDLGNLRIDLKLLSLAAQYRAHRHSKGVTMSI